jgi:hypothetical protein
VLYNSDVPLLRDLRVTLEMIKWEHSIFALPFALCGALLAANGLPATQQLLWIVVAMVAARSAAMAFNRLADASIDAANPRTQTRALPAGTLTPAFVTTFVVVSCAVFVLAASRLTHLALLLSPVALAVVLLYSYTKRFTRWSHLVLGFALGIAPSAAWIAVRGSFDPRILLLTAAVTFWVVRPASWVALDSALLRHQAGALDRSCLSCPDAGAAGWSDRSFWPGEAGGGWRRRSGFASGLRAFAGVFDQSFQVECSVFYHEWSDLGGVSDFYCRGSSA